MWHWLLIKLMLLLHWIGQTHSVSMVSYATSSSPEIISLSSRVQLHDLCLTTSQLESVSYLKVSH